MKLKELNREAFFNEGKVKKDLIFISRNTDYFWKKDTFKAAIKWFQNGHNTIKFKGKAEGLNKSVTYNKSKFIELLGDNLDISHITHKNDFINLYDKIASN